MRCAGFCHVCSNMLFTRPGSLVASAVMAATADVTLVLIPAMTTPALAREEGGLLLLDRLRMGDSQQP